MELQDTIAVKDLAVGDWIELVQAFAFGIDEAELTQHTPCEVVHIRQLESSRVVVQVKYLQYKTFGGLANPPHEVWALSSVWLWRYSRVVPTFLVLTPERRAPKEDPQADLAEKAAR